MLTSRLRRATESFWVLPTLLGLGAVVLAEVVLTLDRHVVGETQVWLLSDLSATGSRSLLTTVGGSMLGVAATSFSITISVLATTSSTYGPRLVRNFMADRGNQLVLAVLTSSFVYCLVVLRAVRSEADGVVDFVPTVAVHVAVLIALLDVAVLVYFIHHIATSVQVTSLQQRIGRELDAVVDLLYPAPTPDDLTRDLALPALPARRETWSVVRADTAGYVQHVGVAALVKRAARAGTVVEVLALPGTHVVAGEPLARFDPDAADGTSEDRGFASAFVTGAARTPHQDIEYAVQQLTEMAVRALSPGTNDPYTAIGALDALTPGLTAVCSRPSPAAGHLDDDGRLRVVLRPRPAHELVRPVFAAVRAWGHAYPTVVVAALHLADRLLGADVDRDRPAGGSPLAAAVVEEVDALVDRYRAGDPHPVDAATVDAALAGLPRS